MRGEHVERVTAQRTAVVLAGPLAPVSGRLHGALVAHRAAHLQHHRKTLTAGLDSRRRVDEPRLLLVQGGERQLGVGVALEEILLVVLLGASPADLHLHSAAGRPHGDVLVRPLGRLQLTAPDQPVGEQRAALQVALLLGENGLEVLAGGGEGGVGLVQRTQTQVCVQVSGKALGQLQVRRSQLGQGGVG